HGFTLDEVDARANPAFAGTIAQRLSEPAPVDAVNEVGVVVLLQAAIPGFGEWTQQRCRSMNEICGVTCLEAPSAGPRDGTRTAVAPPRAHLGAHQLDLPAGALDSRADP